MKKQGIKKYLKGQFALKKQKWFSDIRGEFGMSSIIGLAIGLIVAAFILIPGVRTFATSVITDMQSWWTTTISSTLFPN